MMHIAQYKMLIIWKRRESLRDARNIKAYDNWNVPKITQLYRKLRNFTRG